MELPLSTRAAILSSPNKTGIYKSLALSLDLWPTASHPLILGTEYLKANTIVLDFSYFSCNQKNVPIKTTKRLEIGQKILKSRQMFSLLDLLFYYY
jgi:hypothetical protein